MININVLLRMVLKDNPSTKIALLRLSPLLVGLPVMAVGMGLYHRNQAAVSAIRDVGAVEFGQPVGGLLEPYGRQAWTIEGVAGQHVAIRVFSAWDSTVEVIAPGGTEPIGVDFDSGEYKQPWISDQFFAIDGPYRIVVSGRRGVPTDAAGAYELHVGLAPAEPDTGSGSMTVVREGDAPILIKR